MFNNTVQINVAPLRGTFIAKVLRWAGGGSSNKDDGEPNFEFTNDINEADIITSKTLQHPNLHKIILDIDVPAQLIPSSTPGHSHLLIDVNVPWDNYQDLLKILVQCGVLEPGYRTASLARGFTAVRLPWIKKH